MRNGEKIRLGIPVVVEGKYDQIRLSGILDGPILRTDGFRIFRREETRALIRRLGESRGVVVLTDPDGAGTVIRRALSDALPREKIYHLYVPQIPGKERRKSAPSRAGYLGVEGIPDETLRALLLRFAESHGIDPATGEPCGAVSGEAPRPVGGITKTDLYLCGLTGAPDAAERRNEAALRLGLPRGMTCGAFLTSVNLLTDCDGLRALLTDGEAPA